MARLKDDTNEVILLSSTTARHHGMTPSAPSPSAQVTTMARRPRAAAAARELTRKFLAGLRPPVDAGAADAVVLVVCELVTNSVRHAAGSSFSLRLAVCGDALAVGVTDASSDPPVGRAPDVDGDTGGFGWPMVQRLAIATSVCLTDQGKTVHALIPCRRRAR